MTAKRRPAKMGFEHLHRREPPPRPRLSKEEREWLRATQPRYRYRVMVFGRAATPWRTDVAEMQRDAIRGGHGTVCEQTGLLFMTVPSWIQSERLDP